MSNRDYTEKTEVLDRLLTLILQGKDCCFYGTEGSGKQEVLKELELPKQYVRIEYSGTDLIELSKTVLKKFATLKLPNVLKDAKKKALSKDKKAAQQLPAMIAAESKKKIVLVLDENLKVSGEGTVAVVVSNHRIEGKPGVRWNPEKHPVYEEIKKSDSSNAIFNLLFSEKLNRLSRKERVILEAMVKYGLHTPAEVSEKIDYVSTSVRRFMAIMEEKGFLELRSRGYFELMDKELEKWLRRSGR